MNRKINYQLINSLGVTFVPNKLPIIYQINDALVAIAGMEELLVALSLYLFALPPPVILPLP
jgi:hypothetical protein